MPLADTVNLYGYCESASWPTAGSDGTAGGPDADVCPTAEMPSEANSMIFQPRPLASPLPATLGNRAVHRRARNKRRGRHICASCVGVHRGLVSPLRTPLIQNPRRSHG